nr:MAG TPA: hypothetical protein [Caudoviricetes sp.]
MYITSINLVDASFNNIIISLIIGVINANNAIYPTIKIEN